MGATTVLYEGKPVGTPDPGRVLAGGGRARGEGPVHRADGDPGDPQGGPGRRRTWASYDLSALQYLFLAGERLDPDTYHWASEKLGIPVIDHWWQTETGWAIAANPMGVEPLPIKPGSPTVPMPGYDVRILHDDGSGCETGEEGAICLKLPLPPGTLPTLWGDDAGYVASYLSEHPGYYLTGDGGYFDEDGYLFVMGRIDDVINVAGHRLSTGAIEGVLATHPAVAECAVIGVADEIKGQVPRGLVVLKAGASADGLADELVDAVRNEIGAVAASSSSTSFPRCRRPARARSCARRCAASPTAATNRCRRPSRIPRCSMRCGRSCWAATDLAYISFFSRRSCGGTNAGSSRLTTIRDRLVARQAPTASSPNHESSCPRACIRRAATRCRIRYSVECGITPGP